MARLKKSIICFSFSLTRGRGPTRHFLRWLPFLSLHSTTETFHRCCPRPSSMDPLTGVAFPGNIIPQNRWDLSAKRSSTFISYRIFPQTQLLTFSLNPIAGHPNDQATARLDYNFGKNNFYIRHR